MKDGDPIVISWSAFGDRANGIRFVDPVRENPDRFRLPAEFVGVEPDSQYVTYRVAMPERARAATRVLRPGQWTTMTSAHAPDGAASAIDYIGRFGARAPRAGKDSYRWNAEFVGRDDADRMLVMRSRIVSREGLARAQTMSEGDPIVMTWSGFGDRAHGIRFVDRDPARTDDRYRLPATFVSADPRTQYVTFRVEKPAGNLAATRSLFPGDWATVTSSLRPSATAYPVVGVNAYAATVRAMAPRLAGDAMPTAPTGNYRWNAELVSLDKDAQRLTVRARVVSPDGLSQAEALEEGEPIIITWSGFENRAHGIRKIEPESRAIATSGGFRLAAEFVDVDRTSRYLTFSVETQDGSLITADALEPGDWTTVTSPHQRADQPVVLVDAYDTSRQARRYTWHGELVAFDSEDAAVAFAAHIEDHVLRYVERFSEGDEVVLVWTPQTESDVTSIRYIEHRANSVLDHGYVLPVEFAKVDTDAQRIVFRTKVPPSTLGTWASLEPGDQVAVTSLFDQGGDTAAILSE